MVQANHSKNTIYLNYRYDFIYYTTGAGTLSFNFKYPSVRCCGKITGVYFENSTKRKVNNVAKFRVFFCYTI